MYIYVYIILMYIIYINMTISCCIYCNYRHTSYGCMQLARIIAFNI